MNYVNKYGLYDVKPVGEDGEPTGNDGWIVSAYADKAWLPIPYGRLWITWADMFKWNFIPVGRYPGKRLPPPSRDVVLGFGHFRYVTVDTLLENKWNFCPWTKPKFNLFKLIHQLWKLRGKHRNTFWEQPGYEQVYHVAFMVPFQDRAYFYRKMQEEVPFMYALIEEIDKRLKPSSDSSALLSWVKYDKRPDKEVFERYFGKDHPIYRAIVDEEK